MRTRAPSADWLAAHRAAWAQKPSLRLVYTRWFEALRGACAPGDPVLELGCGPGLLKERYPEIMATDAQPNPYAERVVDAAALPFPNDTVASMVMLDVFHHLPAPERFVAEAARTLKPGGRLVMIEPWLGVVGRLFYRHIHHEVCDLRIDPAAPWSGVNKDPMEGNAALPFLYFRSGGHLERLNLPLRVIRREPFAALPWLLSGGFQAFSLLPASMVPIAERIDRLLSRHPTLTAARCLLVIEKRG